MDNLVTRMGKDKMGKDNMAQVVDAAMRAMPEFIRDSGLTGEDEVDRLVGLMMAHLRQCCIAEETSGEGLRVVAHLARAVALGLVAGEKVHRLGVPNIYYTIVERRGRPCLVEQVHGLPQWFGGVSLSGPQLLAIDWSPCGRAENGGSDE